jgi:hypothetical protein
MPRRYFKVYFKRRKRPVILRDPLDLGRLIKGEEVDVEGQLVSVAQGKDEILFTHIIDKDAIEKIVELKMNRYYGELEE